MRKSVTAVALAPEDEFLALKDKEELTEDDRTRLYEVCISRIHFNQEAVLISLKVIHDKELYKDLGYYTFKDWAEQDCPIRPELAVLYINAMVKCDPKAVLELSRNESRLRALISDDTIRTVKSSKQGLLVFPVDGDSKTIEDYIQETEGYKKALREEKLKTAELEKELVQKERQKNYFAAVVTDAITSTQNIFNILREAKDKLEAEHHDNPTKQNKKQITNMSADVERFLGFYDILRELIVDEFSGYLSDTTIQTENAKPTKTTHKASVKALDNFFGVCEALIQALESEDINRINTSSESLYNQINVLSKANLDESHIDKLKEILTNKDGVGMKELSKVLANWKLGVMEII